MGIFLLLNISGVGKGVSGSWYSNKQTQYHTVSKVGLNVQQSEASQKTVAS